MTRGNDERKATDEHQRSGGGDGLSSHPPDPDGEHVPHAEKLEKDMKADQNEPVEQHRSSRRPRQRNRK